MSLYERLPDAIRETVDEIVEVLRPEPSRLTVPERKDAAKGLTIITIARQPAKEASGLR